MASSPRAPVRRTTAPSTNSSPGRSSPSTTKASSVISKGATARSAVSPRANAPVSRPRPASSSSTATNGDAAPNGRDALVTSLKRETEEKEELLVRVQKMEEQLDGVASENTNLTSALRSAEARLSELYSEQSRMEEDMSTRLEIGDKLRSQVRDLEKEKREIMRRYGEQTASFEAERQALYDNEQHLKSRIQSLTTARKAQQEEAAERPSSPAPSLASAHPLDAEPTSPDTPVARVPPTEDHAAEQSDGPEITALKMELSTLSTSHSSLQNTLQHLQKELQDLKRVNGELQEENESFGLLLMERALSGTGVDMIREMGGHSPKPLDDTERGSVHSSRSVLDRVPEEADESELEDGEPQTLSLATELENASPSPLEPRSRRRARKLSSASPPDSPSRVGKGESLAGLPLTGPGLDLAAELGRAESKDFLEGGEGLAHSSLAGPSSPVKRSARSSDPPAVSVATVADEQPRDVSSLKQEVKALKEANKALSLYASKILDRIIMTEGFEHVLAVDFDPAANPPSSPRTPQTAMPLTTLSNANSPPSPAKASNRPQSMFIGRSSSLKGGNGAPQKFDFPASPDAEKLTTFANISLPPPPASQTPEKKRANRRSLSLDWKSFSIFGSSSSEKEKEKGLRPLTLRPGAESTLSNARKLETHEDDEDRKERERLQATMKLMGYEKPPAPPPVASTSQSQGTPSTEVPLSSPSPAPAENPRPRPASNRFSFLRALSSGSNTPPPTEVAPAALTSDHLAQAEAATKLSQLDAHEKAVSAELARGGSGGFTELEGYEGRMTLGDEWRSRRTRSDAKSTASGGSGVSLVWSVGKDGDEDA